MANGSFVFFCKKKTQIILLKKNIFHKYCFVVDSLCLHQSINQSLNFFMSKRGMRSPNHPRQRLMYETYDNKLTFVKFCLSSVVIIDHSETNRPTRAPDQILERLNITKMEFLSLRHRRLSCEMSLAARSEGRQLFS